VTEKPMLFSPAMVRAIQAGTKSQTRRVVKPQPVWRGTPTPGITAHFFDDPGRWFSPPYPVGTRVWVRETWWCNGESETPESCEYRADGEMPPHMAGAKWRSPMFMPRWAAREFLEITGVSVEPVQNISEADALAEGILQTRDGGYAYDAEGRGYHGADPRISYMHLWDSINGKKHPWESNPWVWCYEFRRVTP